MVWSPDDLERAYKEHVAKTAGTPAPEPTRPAPPDPVDEQIESELGDLAPPGCDNGYVLAGVESQIVALAGAAPGARNTALFVSAKALGRLAEVERAWLRKKLKTACELNGLTADDGIAQVTKTIRSGFAAADRAGERVIPEGPEYFVTVTEVPASRLSGSSNGAAPIAAGGAGGSAGPPGAPRDGIFDLEGDFWKRDSLAHIFDAALMRMTPPWGVLAHCAARALFLVRPQVRLPALIGGPGSLNWFGAVAAPSGGGKSSSSSVAADLVKGVPDSAIRNMGSGEGIALQYRPPGKNPDDRESLMFLCEEIDTLKAMDDRQGSTTMSTLRNAFMGDPPGHSYVKTIKARALAKHEYRMTLILGVQPGRAGSLLEDAYSGTLQRFQWFPGFDPRCTRVAARPSEFVNSLPGPDPGHWNMPRILTVPAEAIEAILEEGERRAKGNSDAIDGHVLFVREKFALALALLDDRTEMTAEDWRLAGIAMDVSRATREWVAREYLLAEDELAGRRGRVQGVSRLASDEARADMADDRIMKCARWAWARLRKVGPQTNRELQQTCDGKLRRWFNAAIAWLRAEGWIEEIVDSDGKKRWSAIRASKP